MITFPSYDTIFTSRQSFTFSLSEGVDASVTIYFRANGILEWTEIWNESYHTINGKVTLYDIGQLLADSLGGCIVGTVKFSVKERDYGTVISTGNREYVAMVCECMEAEEVIGDGFLTMFRGLKRTFVGAKEEVYFYQKSGAAYSVLAEYMMADDSLEMVEQEPEVSTVAGISTAIKRIDMSPGQFVETNKKLVHLTLRVSGNS